MFIILRRADSVSSSSSCSGVTSDPLLMNKALDLLSLRDYSRRELSDKLVTKAWEKKEQKDMDLGSLKQQASDICDRLEELDLVHDGSSMAYVGKGHQLRVKMLVEGMMLPSGNDAATVLAAAAGRAIAGDETLSGADAVAVFVDEMNAQADALGFEKTHFSNPDGWHTGSHYTSLNDLARIAKLALENDTIRRYMRLAEDDTHFLTGQQVLWENTNLLLVQDSGFYRSDAVGMKTGFTRPAGYSLMSAFAFEEGEIVIGLFGYTDKTARFNDAIQMVKAVKEQLRLEMQQTESIE